MTFILREMYSRKEIYKKIGGSMVTYLPNKDGLVLCGCFCPKSNPKAPAEILCVKGEGDDVALFAEMVWKQKIPIPVFLRRAPGKWEYVGRYLCTNYSIDAALLQCKNDENPERVAGDGPIDGPIIGVLSFKKDSDS